MLQGSYGSKIAKIQFGNEWQGTFWYAGSAEQFVASHNVVYDVARLHAPDAKVVLGGFRLGRCAPWRLVRV